MMQEFVVRPWQDGDDERICALFDRVERWLSDDAYARKFDDKGLTPEGVLLAEQGDRIVGHLMGTRTEIHYEGRPQVFGTIGQVMVDGDCRGMGIGKALLERIIQYHRDGQARGILLWTQPARIPAYPMYVKAGFETVVKRALWKVAPVGSQTSLIIEPYSEAFAERTEAIRQEWMRSSFPVGIENLRPDGDGWWVVRREGSAIGYLRLGEREDAPFVSHALARTADATEVCNALLTHLKQQGHVQASWLTAIGSVWDEALRQRGYTEVRETGDVRMCLSIGNRVDTEGLRPDFDACFTW